MSTGAAASVLVLGAYGAVGREVVRSLATSPGVLVTGAGRRREPLRSICDPLGVKGVVLDVADRAALARAIPRAGVVINCVGPYLLHGAAIAAACVELGAHYVDVASEQEHYRRLGHLHARAVTNGVSLVCAAGLYPGISGILMNALISSSRSGAQVELLLGMGAPPDDELGQAQLKSGLLELSYPLQIVEDGNLVPFAHGQPAWEREFHSPFGTVDVMPWPQIEVLECAEDDRIVACRSGLWMPGTRRTPAPLLRLVRRLDPARRPLVYRWLGRLLEAQHRRATSTSRAAELGLRAVVRVTVHDDERNEHLTATVSNGLKASAYLPALLTPALLSGSVPVGLETAGGLVRLNTLVETAEREGWDLALEGGPAER